MIDQLRQLAVFSKVVGHGSFRGAARSLGLSPSVVSHHISQLEAYLGVALIYRSTRKLSLTREGARLLGSVDALLGAVEGELVALSSAAMKPAGALNVTAPSVLSQSRLTEAIGQFCMAYPDIELTLDFSDVRQDMIEGGYDVAIRMGTERRGSATVKPLFVVPRWLVSSGSYMAKRGVVARPEEVADWDWIGLSPVAHIRPVFSRGEEVVRLNPSERLKVNDAMALYQLARAGAGLAVVPYFLAEADIVAGRAQRLLPEWQLGAAYVFAEWHPSAPKHGLIRLLVDALRDTLGG